MGLGETERHWVEVGESERECVPVTVCVSVCICVYGKLDGLGLSVRLWCETKHLKGTMYNAWRGLVQLGDENSTSANMPTCTKSHACHMWLASIQIPERILQPATGQTPEGRLSERNVRRRHRTS